MRIPKLRGFKNRFKIEFEVVNVGAIAGGGRARRVRDRPSPSGPAPPAKPKGDAQITVNQDILRAVGLVRNLNKPLKILGNGDLSTALFVVADGFTASARSKIEAAGGTVNVLEVPTRPLKAIGVGAELSADATAEAEAATTATKKTEPKKAKATAKDADEADAATPTRPKAKASAKAKPAAEPTAAAEPEAATPTPPSTTRPRPRADGARRRRGT